MTRCCFLRRIIGNGKFEAFSAKITSAQNIKARQVLPNNYGISTKLKLVDNFRVIFCFIINTWITANLKLTEPQKLVRKVTKRQTEDKTEYQSDRRTDRKLNLQADRQTEDQRKDHTDIQIKYQTDRHKKYRTDRQTDRRSN